MTGPHSGRKVFWTFLAGVFLVQLAWIAATPAFRGSDEFDHVYRAQGVAHGQLLPTETSTNGRGDLTETRLSVIRAAGPVCETYEYTKPDNCNPVDPVDGAWNRVASGASNYNPVYYAITGPVSLLFDGAGANYAMRLWSALLCGAIVAWAAVLWRRRMASRWAVLGLSVALTPVLLYSTAIAAPNGLSYVSGVLVWVAGLALLKDGNGPADRSALAAGVVGSLLLCNTHTTGPLWLALIASCLVLLEPRRWLLLARERAGAIALVAAAVGAAASAAWTLSTGANIAQGESTVTGNPPVGELAVHHLLWMLQSIAVFPLRNEPAPAAVYFLWLLPFVIALVVAGLRTSVRVRFTLIWIVALNVSVSTILTLLSYNTAAYSWQGRYALPLTVGLVLVATAKASPQRDLRAPLLLAAVLCMSAAMAISVGSVALKEADFVARPWTDHLSGGPYLAACAAALGVLLMAATLIRSSGTTDVRAPIAPVVSERVST